MNIEPTLGEKIQSARKELRWSQARLAEHLGTVQATVSRVENDEPCSTLVAKAFERFLSDVASKALFPDPASKDAGPKPA